MSKSGQELEKIVKDIEYINLPEGFNIDSNIRVYDDSGVQVAELDIVVTGIINSSQWKCLYECRDRPSKGPAGVSWIEQLIGRKERFNFDEVTAVSSAGFSKPAIDLAKSKGIGLRTVEKFTSEELSKFVLNDRFTFEFNLRVMNSAYVQLSPESQHLQPKFDDLLTTITPGSKIIYDSKSGEFISFVDAFSDAIDSEPAIYNDIPPNNQRTIGLHVRYPTNRYTIPFDQEIAIIHKIDFMGIILHYVEVNPIPQLSIYRDEIMNNNVAIHSTFKSHYAGKTINLDYVISIDKN